MGELYSGIKRLKEKPHSIIIFPYLSTNTSVSIPFLGGYTCRVDFERFAERIGVVKYRAEKILDRYMDLPAAADALVGRSFVNDKMKRHYLRIVRERDCKVR